MDDKLLTSLSPIQTWASNDAKYIPIVFAINDYYAPMFSACLLSLVEHSSSENFYDIVVLNTDISNENQLMLSKMISDYSNCSLRFLNVKHIVEEYHLKANEHISVETYYRLLIQEVLPEYDKVLYLDADIIIIYDVAKLYFEDIENYMLAAASDPDFLGQISGANKVTMKYIEDTLHLKNPFDYFQAGVILFNEKKMRQKFCTQEWLEIAQTPYMYNDQDILNLYCEGNVKKIDMSWNLITDHERYRVKNVISYAPKETQDEYYLAHATPKIIHYAGKTKPWMDPNEDYAEEFWHYLRKSPYYEVVISRLCERIIDSKIELLEEKNKKMSEEALNYQIRIMNDKYLKMSEEINSLKYVNEKYNRMRSSLTYKIGNSITIIPRLIRRLFRCIVEHGLRYTLTISSKEFFSGKKTD